jgi:hypothetical protein
MKSQEKLIDFTNSEGRGKGVKTHDALSRLGRVAKYFGFISK